MTPGQGFAADSHQVTDAEVQVVSDFFAPYVKTIKKSFYVYNWFNATRSADAQQLLKPISASDVIGYQDVQFMSKLHWSKVSEDRGDVGLGLYGAVDPLISRGFGTMGILGKSDPGDKNWVLTEIRIPVGMRMLNAAVTFENGVPENIMEILDKAKCTQDIRRSRYLRKDLGGKADGLFEGMLSTAEPRCFEFGKKVFNEKLKIDGVAYIWARTPVSAEVCPGVPATEMKLTAQTVAFLITRGDRIQPDDVRMFNRQSTDDFEDRTRIQSEMNFLLRQVSAEWISMRGVLPEEVLWPDTQSSNADMTQWLRENVYGCDPSVDFGL